MPSYGFEFGGRRGLGRNNRLLPLREEEERRAQNQSNSLPNLNLLENLSSGGGQGFGGGLGSTASSTLGGKGGGLAAKNVAGSSSGGLGSSLASAGPWAALAAAIALNENYQGNIGNRGGESFPLEYALTGRSLYKDAPGWGEKADDVVPGLGSGIRTAGLLSSPVDMFRGDTYSDLWDEVKSGGTLGGILKGIF